jgi:hypothetical protein
MIKYNHAWIKLKPDQLDEARSYLRNFGLVDPAPSGQVHNENKLVWEDGGGNRQISG